MKYRVTVVVEHLEQGYYGEMNDSTQDTDICFDVEWNNTEDKFLKYINFLNNRNKNIKYQFVKLEGKEKEFKLDRYFSGDRIFTNQKDFVSSFNNKFGLEIIQQELLSYNTDYETKLNELGYAKKSMSRSEVISSKINYRISDLKNKISSNKEQYRDIANELKKF